MTPADDAAILDSALSKDRDRGSDSAPPASPPPEAKTSPEAPPASDGSDENSQRHVVPLAEVLSERKKRQESDRLYQEAQKRIQEYQDRVDSLLRAQQPQVQHQPDPDPYTDPVGAMQTVQQRLSAEFDNRLLNMNQAVAERMHGKQVVAEALNAALQAGIANQFRSKPDPYGELVSWHKREQALAKIGDPDNYEKSLRDKLRQEILAELKGGAGQQQQRFPGTLADSTPAGPQGSLPPTDGQILGRLFDSNRQRRAL